MVKAFGIAGVVAIALAMSAAAAPISRLDGSDIGLVKRDLPHGGNDDEIPDPDYPPRKRDFGDPHVVAVGGSRPPLHNDKRDFGDPHNDKRTIDGGEPPISPAPGSGVVHVKPVSPGDQHIANPGQHNR
ncbi:uncharacterized protein PFL1_00012 [Pseudozyma flocculosa PF-1]|uniref:uncharacterized protein n=1 Tax=Pseudozyma flocculosa PF-1 TaxID=1277687 RepID=UPI0004561261|nr:uncharacterized protein PFL1_00012 [Pseudozyma flocculosa PF-1]EPQ31813.1 hypothetical protein PFL1_00012 [Pseudozyma flocculosa PF-1]